MSNKNAVLKKGIVLLIIIVFLNSFSIFSTLLYSESTSVSILLEIGNPVMKVNNATSNIDPISTDTVPVIVQSRTLLPIRAIIEAIGGQISWNAEDRLVTIDVNGKNIKLSMLNPVYVEHLVYSGESGGMVALGLYEGSKTMLVNGQANTNDVPAMIINDRTFMPLRFIAENAGCKVDWYDEKKEVVITYPDPSAIAVTTDTPTPDPTTVPTTVPTHMPTDTVMPTPNSNQPPEVYAGEDKKLTVSEGTTSINETVALDSASATDDGNPNPTLGITWSIVSGPGSAVFNPSDTSLNPTVTLNGGVGDYVLRLTADDGEKTSYNEVIITVETGSTHGTDYYISTQADFDTYKDAIYQPGDRILLERGKKFEGMLVPGGSGTEENPIKITTYGTGDRPRIDNNKVIYSEYASRIVSAGICLINVEYWEIDGIEITNDDGGPYDPYDINGITVLIEDESGNYYNHIYIYDCHIHNVNGNSTHKRRGGIEVYGSSPLNDLLIVGNRIEHVGGDGISIDGGIEGIGKPYPAHEYSGSSPRPQAWTNVYVARNYIAYTAHTAAVIRDSDNAVFEYNTVAYPCQHAVGNAIYNFNTLGMKFQYNEVYGNNGPEDKDRGAFDADWNSKDTYIQYNYTHDNDWFCSIMKKANKNVYIRYNLSVNEKRGAYFFGFNNSDNNENVQIYNNTHYFDESISGLICVCDRHPHNTFFKNNIFYFEGSGDKGSFCDSGSGVVFDNNLYYNIASIPTSESNAIISDPKFMNAGGNPFNLDMTTLDELLGYRLQSDSPCIDAGVDISNPGSIDFWGYPIPQGGVYDVGCAEWNDKSL